MAIVRRQNTRSMPTRTWNLANVGDVGSIFDEFDRLFEDAASSMVGRRQWAASYPVDLYETPENVTLEMAVPGLSADDLDVSVEGRQLTISGKVAEAEDEERRYWLQGIPRGPFSRTVTLPATVDTDRVEAKVHQGLLTLTLPKVAEAKARRIAIAEG